MARRAWASVGFWEIWVPRTIGALAVALGLLLAGMIWYIYASATAASDVLVRGQAVELLNATHRTLMRLPRRPQPHDFDGLLAELGGQGLRYAAVLGADGRPHVEVGEPSGPIDRDRLRHTPPMEPRAVGDRFRVHDLPPPPPGRADVPPPPPPASPDVEPDGGARRPPFHPPPIVVEFAPLSAIAARALARRTLWGGMVAVPLFIAGGLALAYTVRQRERLTQRIEHGRRLAALGEMSAVIAHEIRNPLASLKGHAQLLSESLTGDTRQSKADRVVGEAVRIENLVSDLLEFSRTGTLDLREADPIAVLHTAVDDIDRARVIERSAGAPRRWRLDAASMKQVLANILRNALQASPDDSPVEAAVYATGPSLVFEIRDHGTGIPAGEEEKIFEPFHTHKTRGTGLGLALVRRIVAQHGGQVVAHNAPGGGAVFRVSIPRR